MKCASQVLGVFLAAFLLFRALPACAAEFSALGHWMFGFYSGNVYGQKHEDIDDRFQAVQRLRTQFGFSASPSLSGQIQLEMGKTNWGQAASGGALGADGKDIKLRYAFLDWATPKGGVKVRMGLQPVNLPAFVNGSPIYSEDSAAITVSGEIVENIAATAFWARASAANTAASRPELPAFDTMDFFGLAVPVKGDAFRLSPYGMFANIGINSIGSRGRKSDGDWQISPYKSSLRTVANNTLPIGGLDILANPRHAGALNPWGSVFWIGLGGETTFLSPFSFAAEFAYGEANFGSVTVGGRDFEMRRTGYYGAFLAEYRLDWAIPGLLGWYSSGDDDNPWNGSERMPVGKSANRDWKVLNLAYDGAPFCPAGGAQIISPNGSIDGTWGLVARVRDISFLANLSHTLRAGYVRGTNDPGMLADNRFFSGDSPGGYLTTKDEAFELDFETRYKIFENLTLIFDADWLRVNWNKDVWNRIDNNLVKDFYRAGLTAYYHF